MDSSTLKLINDTNAEKALSDSRHQALITSQTNTSNTVLSATTSLIKYLEGRTSKTQVVNQLRSIGTPDALKVIPEIKALHETLKTHKNIDLSEITKVMQGVLDEAKKIPKELPKEQEQKFIDYTKQLSGLGDAIRAVEKVVKAQELIVEPTDLKPLETAIKGVETTIKEKQVPDLTNLQSGLIDIVKAVNKIIIPEYKTDNKEVEKLIKVSNKLLKGIIDKPVSSGGGGQAWTAINTTNIPMPLNLNDNGELKSSVTATNLDIRDLNSTTDSVTVSGLVTTISTIHQYVHEGIYYSGGYYNASVADNASIMLLLQGSTPVTHVEYELTTSGDGIADFYEGTTFSAAGTSVTMSNHNRRSANTFASTVTHTPTVTADGTQVNGTNLIPGGTKSSGTGGGQTPFTGEFVLAASTNYLIRFTNKSGGVQKMNIELRAYEHAI